MINLFELIGELLDLGPAGAVDFGREPDPGGTSLILLVKAAVSLVCLLLINGLLFAFLITPTPQALAVAVGVHVVYFAISAFVRPLPDSSNLGLFGTIFNDPFAISDDTNRFLLIAQLLLLPGRCIVQAAVIVSARMLGIKRRASSAERKGGTDREATRRKLKTMRAIGTILSMGILCFGSAIGAFWTWNHGNETRNWSPVEGTIVDRSSDRTGSRDPRPMLKMHFEYTVDGKSYSGTDYFYDPSEHVTVYFDPKDPSRASSQSGAPWLKFTAFSLFAALGAVGLIGYFVLARWPHLASDEYLHEGDMGR